MLGRVRVRGSLGRAGGWSATHARERFDGKGWWVERNAHATCRSEAIWNGYAVSGTQILNRRGGHPSHESVCRVPWSATGVHDVLVTASVIMCGDRHWEEERAW
jgi:hypothetical protein